MPQAKCIESTMGISNQVFSTDIRITETNDVWESVKWGEKARGARDGVEKMNVRGFVEND